MNGRAQERLQGGDGREGAAQHPGSRPSGQTTRTSRSEGRTCCVCGTAITGWRRNRFWSDRCRMRASRAAKQARIEHGLAKIESAVEKVLPDMTDTAAEKVRDEICRAIDQLRAELLPGGGHPPELTD